MTSPTALSMAAMRSRYKEKISNLKQSLSYFQDRCRILEQILSKISPEFMPPANVSAQCRFLREFHDGDNPVLATNAEELVQSPEPFAHFILDNIYRNLEREPQGRRWEPTVLMLCYVLRTLSGKCYDYLRNFLPLPCKQTLYTHFSSGLSEWKSCLTDLSHVPVICDLFRRRCLLEDSVTVDIVLGVDTMAIEPVQDALNSARVGDNHVFLFQVLPFRPDLTPFPVHLLTQRNGNAGIDVKKRLHELIEILGKCGIVTSCIATDGDSGYNELHTAMFDSWWPQFCSNGIEEARKSLSTYNTAIIADFLHLIKNARSRLLNNRVSLSPDGEGAFSAKELNMVLQLGPSLADYSAKGRMRDSYALELFTLNNFLRLMSRGKLQMAFYILPYCLWEQLLRNQHLSLQMRREFAVLIVEIFAYHIEVLNNLDASSVSQNKKDGIPQYFCSYKHATRVLNTLMQFLVETEQKVDNFALDRFGTHVVECLFGQIRIICGYKHDWKRVLRSFANIMFINDVTTILGHRLHPRGRENIAGVKLCGDSDTIYIKPNHCCARQLYEAVLASIQRKKNSEIVSESLFRKMLQDIRCFRQYLDAFKTACEQRKVPSQRIWHGTPVSNATILSRLISFTRTPNKEEFDPNEAGESDISIDLDEEIVRFLEISRLETSTSEEET